MTHDSVDTPRQVSSQPPLEPVAYLPAHDEVSEGVAMSVGELARRLGVSTDVLRAWERRHDLFQPHRTPQGYRRYSVTDEHQARRVMRLRSEGLSLAEAVALVRQGDQECRLAARSADLGESSERVRNAASRFLREASSACLVYDQGRVMAAFRMVEQGIGPVPCLTYGVVPLIEAFSQGTATGEGSHSHLLFASATIRQCIRDMAMPTPAANAPRVLVASPSPHDHDLTGVVMARLLTYSGWAVTDAGGGKDAVSIAWLARRNRPHAIVVHADREVHLGNEASALRGVAQRWTVFLAGKGATPMIAERIGARQLPLLVSDAAADINASHRRSRHAADHAEASDSDQ